MNTQIPLVRSILHPTDFSAASNRAFAHALAIALLRQTELTLLHIGEDVADDDVWSNFPPVRETLERWGLLEPGSARTAVYDELKVSVRKFAMKSRDPVRATIDFLDQDPHELVVLATQGSQGGKDWLHQSSAEQIARGSGAMTLFVPGNSSRGLVALEDGDLNLNRILVPVDTTIDSSAAIEFSRRAAEIIGDGGVEITLLHAGEKMPALPTLPQGADWSWQTSLKSGDPVDAILDAVDQQNPDLVVMTTNGRDTLRQALAGSTTERVLRKADCPVLAVPDGMSRSGD